jgi:hypothetical protein
MGRRGHPADQDIIVALIDMELNQKLTTEQKRARSEQMSIERVHDQTSERQVNPDRMS